MRVLASVAACVLAAGTAHAQVSGDPRSARVALAQAGEWAPPTELEQQDRDAPDEEASDEEASPPPRRQPPPRPPRARREQPPPREPSARQASPQGEAAPARQAPSPGQAPPPTPVAQEAPRQAPPQHAPPQPAPAQQPSCPPPQPATAPAPPGTISGSSICGATIVGGTISGATIIGGTISGGAISGGTVSQSNIEATPGKPAGNAQPGAPQAAAPAGDPPAQPQPAPAKPEARTPPPPRRDARTGSSPQGRAGEKHGRPRADHSADDDDEDEEDLAARALERALVQRGALLLPIWAFELAPGFTYGHTSQDTFATFPGASGSPPSTLGVRKRIHQVTGTLTARLGLPLDLQIEAAVPASLVVSELTVAGAASDDASAFGLGDPRFSLTWQMIHGGNVAPDIFLAGSWKSRLGSSPFEADAGKLGLGSGYNALGATLTAVKSADPLVLLANVGYTENLAVQTKQGRRKLGNTFGLGGGAILAVSPDTSLSFLLDFHYKPDDTIANKAVLGSDETVAVLQLGLGRVLSRSVLLNVNAALGVTADSPNFQLGVSMPVRF